jgi:hypothetical protein
MARVEASTSPTRPHLTKRAVHFPGPNFNVHTNNIAHNCAHYWSFLFKASART